jgi:heptaprenyl diphosphate synthase
VKSRSALTDVLLAPSVLTRYEKDINEFRGEAHRLLNALGGDDTYLPVLRQLVDETSQLLL